MTCCVREVGPAFAQVLERIHSASFETERWSKATFAKLLALPSRVALLVDGAGFVLVGLAADEAEILTLAVVPERRRQGVGGALLDAAMGAARRRGAATMYLEVEEANEPARSLYASRGFRQVGRRERYYPNGAGALLLAAVLRPASCEAGAG